MAARTTQRRRWRLVTTSRVVAAGGGSAGDRVGGGRAGGGSGDRVRRARSRGRPLGAQRRGHDEQRQDREPDPPPGALGREPEARLDEERVGEQRDKRSAVAQGVEPVGVARVRVRVGGPADARIPVRDERRGGGHRERGRADDDEEDPEQRRDDGQVRPVERGDIAWREERRHDGDDHDADVHGGTAAGPQPGGHEVGVQVPEQQQGLEEHQDRGPDGGRTAEDRQDKAPDHRLRREQQERRHADGRAEDGARGHARGAADPLVLAQCDPSSCWCPHDRGHRGLRQPGFHAAGPRRRVPRRLRTASRPGPAPWTQSP